MYRILKYNLPVLEKQQIELPKFAEIIRVDDVDGMFFLWAIVNADEDWPKEKRNIEMYKTGQPIDNLGGLKYLGFCKLFVMQELGLYCFERTNQDE